MSKLQQRARTPVLQCGADVLVRGSLCPILTITKWMLFRKLDTSVRSPKSLWFRRGPEGCVENGPAAVPRLRDRLRIDLDTRLLAPCRRPILNATKPKGFR